MKDIKMIHIAIIGLLVYLIFFRSPKKDPLPNTVGAPPLPDDEQIKDAFMIVADKYGSDIAQNVERIYRWETNHFRSPLYKDSLSAGMNASVEVYPYGWSSLREMWDREPDKRPIGLTNRAETGGKRLVVFPNILAGLTAVAEVMADRGNDADRWYGGEGYQDKINQLQISYTV